LRLAESGGFGILIFIYIQRRVGELSAGFRKRISLLRSSD
jgi:hypothetical protein